MDKSGNNGQTPATLATSEYVGGAVSPSVLTPKKYDDRPYVYTATRPECDCIVAVQPMWPQKPAGVVLAEWAKSGWQINTVPKSGLRVNVCHHDFSDAEEADPLAYVAEKKCGCVVGMWKVGIGEKSVGNVLKIWGEESYFIQTVNPDDVEITAECPHESPLARQQALALFG